MRVLCLVLVLVAVLAGGCGWHTIPVAGPVEFDEINRARRIVQGASTITQQLAKNRFLTARRSPIRKLREALMALTLEARYDKETILEAYLNEIYLGQDGGYRQLKLRSDM